MNDKDFLMYLQKKLPILKKRQQKVSFIENLSNNKIGNSIQKIKKDEKKVSG